MIDAKIRGTINSKTPETTYELFEKMAINNYKWHSSWEKPNKLSHVYDVDVAIAPTIHVEALSKKIDGLLVMNQLDQMMQCDLCGEWHEN